MSVELEHFLAERAHSTIKELGQITNDGMVESKRLARSDSCDVPRDVDWPSSFIAVAIGLGLAAATGFRVFLPLLVAGLAARWGALPLSEGFQWLSTTGTLVALTTASVVEVAAYYIPGVDHVLDVVASPAALIAGVIASASVMADIPPAIMWPVAIIGGGGVAGMTKLTSALVRAKTATATAGLANPVVSTGETAGAIAIAVMAIVIPLLCLLALVVLLVWIGRRARRLVLGETH